MSLKDKRKTPYSPPTLTELTPEQAILHGIKTQIVKLN
jgi:hypothetical protein